MIEFIRKIIEWLKKLFGIKPQEVICMGTFDDCNTCPTYPDFDENQYYMNYLDLAKAKQNNSEFSALQHWCLHGRNEGRSYKLIDRYGKEYVTPADWDAAQYAKNYNQIAQWGSNWPVDGMGEVNVLDHYAKYGQYEGKTYKAPDITDWEDEAYLYHFKDEKPPISASEYDTNPLQHYYDWGFAAGWKFKPDGWSSAQYLKNNPDIAEHEYFKTHPLEHWWKYGEAEGRSYTEKPLEIKDFIRVSECDNTDSCYFGIGEIDGEKYFGVYGYQFSESSSELYKYPHTKVQTFDSESVFDIKEFKGKGYLILERGEWQAGIDRAIVCQRHSDGIWRECFRNPDPEKKWAMNLLVNTDGYLYATVGDIYRTSDGTNWSRYTYDNYSHLQMCSKDGEVWSTGGTICDWGGENKPAVFRNSSLAWVDDSRVGDGFWGITAFKNDIFLGGTGHARIVRYSDKKTVLDRSSLLSCFSLVVDKDTDTLLAMFNEHDGKTSGAEVWASKDGNRWYQINGKFSVSGLFCSYYDEKAKEIWIGGGNWTQGSNPGNGRIYKSVRG